MRFLGRMKSLYNTVAMPGIIIYPLILFSGLAPPPLHLFEHILLHMLLRLLMLWCLLLTATTLAWKRSQRRRLEMRPRKTMTEENEIFQMARSTTVQEDESSSRVSTTTLRQVQKTIKTLQTTTSRRRKPMPPPEWSAISLAE